MLQRPVRFRFTLLAATAIGVAAGHSATALDPQAAPRVILAWASGPLEARLALDRPAGAEVAGRLVATRIQFATDPPNVEGWRRLGSPPLRPPLGTMKIAGARLADGGRTLILATDPHPRDAVYLLETTRLAGAQPGRAADAGAASRVAYDLTGASVSWSEHRPGAMPLWQGSWPDLNFESSRRLARGSAEHERGFARLAERGLLSLESLVTLPMGRARLRIAASGPLEATLDGEKAAGATGDRAEFTLESTGEPSVLVLTVRTGEGSRPFSLEVTCAQDGEKSPTTLARGRQLVPWSPAPVAQPSPITPPEFALSGGDRRRGEEVFFSESSKCSVCHKIGGKGGAVGPDLSGLAGRPVLDVYRDIAEPSAAIHPDFVPYTVSLKDGRVVAGILRATGPEAVQVVDAEARATEFRRSEIEELRPGTASIMPVGLAGAIGDGAIRDLIAFLTSADSGRPSAGRR